MAKSVSYLRHAIAPPKLEPAQAPRPRLTNLLNASIDKRLILIAAPAGFGKTTLLAEFGAQADRPVCWARLVEADQDVMRLAGLVWATLEKRFRRLRGRVQVDRLVGASPRALARAISGGVSEAIDEPFALALDDVHWLNASDEGREFLGALVESAPPNMSVIAAGREVPDIPLVKLLAADQLVTLDGDSLALRADELADVVSRRTGESLTEADVAGLMEETGGWVTGVLLSERLVGKRLPGLLSNGQPLSYEYLASVVFDRQPKPIQRFLMDSSVLPVMTAELSDTVLERTDSQAMLDEVLKRGLFITVTEDRPRTYEYHQLFREYLQLRAARLDGGRHRRLLFAAGKALAAIDEWAETAVDLLLQADEVELAAEMATGLRGSLFKGGRINTLQKLADEFRSKGQEVPYIELSLSTALEGVGRRTDAAAINARLLGEIERSNREDSNDLKIRCLLNIGHLSLNTQQWDELRETIEALRRLLPGAQHALGEVGLARLEAMFLADVHGRWAAAAKVVGDAIEKWEEDLNVLSIGQAWMTKTYVELNGGELENALSSAHRALAAVLAEGYALGESSARLNLAFVKHTLGEFQTALNEIHLALNPAQLVDDEEDQGSVRITEAEMLMDFGLLPEATLLLDAASWKYAECEAGPFWENYLMATRACVLRRGRRLEEAKSTLLQADRILNFRFPFSCPNRTHWSWIHNEPQTGCFNGAANAIDCPINGARQRPMSFLLGQRALRLRGRDQGPVLVGMGSEDSSEIWSSTGDFGRTLMRWRVL